MARRGRAEGPWGGAVLADVLKACRTGWTPGLTLLFGDDLYHLDHARRAILDALVPESDRAFGLSIVAEGPVSTGELVGQARSAGMFASRRVVFVRDASVIEGEPEPLLAYAASPPGDSFIVVRAAKLDRKRRLHQAFLAGKVLEFRAAGDSDLPALLRELADMAEERGVRVDREAATLLAEITGGDLQRAASELDKIRDWLGDQPKRDAGAALVRALVSGSLGMTGFELSDALLERDAAAALLWTRRMLDAGEEPLRVLGSIAWRARTILQAKGRQASGAGPQELAQTLRSWRHGAGVGRLLDRYTWEEALAFPARLLDADRQLKSRSIGGRAVLESLVQTLAGRG